MKKLEIQCSSRGKRHAIPLVRAGMIRLIQSTIDSGWGSCGGVLYCPECTKTWAKRNGDRPMGDNVNTMNVIWCLAFDSKIGGRDE